MLDVGLWSIYIYEFCVKIEVNDCSSCEVEFDIFAIGIRLTWICWENQILKF